MYIYYTNKRRSSSMRMKQSFPKRYKLISAYAITRRNLFNSLGSNVKNFYKAIRNIKAGTVKKAGFVFTTSALVVALTTGCGSVTPPTPFEPISKIEIPTGFDKDYFEEICFTWETIPPEYHNIVRWIDDPKIFLINPSEEQKEIAKNKINELAEFTNYVIIPEIVDDINLANTTVKWCDLNEIPGQQVGSCQIYVNSYIIYKAEILVYKNLDSILTKHNFLEEVGGALGVTNDSYKYDDSIFYQGPCQSTSFTIQDLAVGNVLYQLNPGTTLSEFEEIFENSTKTYSFLDGF